jgi:hypothetical protein
MNLVESPIKMFVDVRNIKFLCGKWENLEEFAKSYSSDSLLGMPKVS